MRATDDPRELCDPLVQTAVNEQWPRNCVRCGARWPLRCGVCGTCIGKAKDREHNGDSCQNQYKGE